MKFMILDGNSIINRAFYGIKLLTNKHGVFTNGIYGFLKIMFLFPKASMVCFTET